MIFSPSLILLEYGTVSGAPHAPSMSKQPERDLAKSRQNRGIAAHG
jgi:hypothetical protein